MIDYALLIQFYTFFVSCFVMDCPYAAILHLNFAHGNKYVLFNNTYCSDVGKKSICYVFSSGSCDM